MELYNTSAEVNAALDVIGEEKRAIVLTTGKELLNRSLERGTDSITLEYTAEIIKTVTVVALVRSGAISESLDSEEDAALVSSFLKENGNVLVKLSLSIYKLALEEVFRTEGKKSNLSGTMKKAMAFAAGAALGALFS